MALAFCPNCGTEQDPGANFCRRCGMNLHTRAMPTIVSYAPDERRKGLHDMKLSFIFYMIAGALALIPVLGGVGALPALLGLIFFVLAWRSLGRSSLAESSRYESTGNWFIYTFVILIVVIVVGSIVVVAGMIWSLASSQGPPPNPQTFYQSSFFRGLFGGIFALGAVASAIWLFPWYMASSSMAKLSIDVSQPRLKTSGRLFFLNALVGTLAVLVLAALFSSGLVSFGIPLNGGNPPTSSGLYSPPFTGVGFLAYYLITVVGSVVLVLAGYEGYTSVKNQDQM